MKKIQNLAGQTLIYGLSTILVRALAWLVAPFHTRIFHPTEYGIISEMYAYVAFINVVFMYGMETAFFRFATKKEQNADAVFSTIMFSLLSTTAIFVTGFVFLSGKIAIWLQYPGKGALVAMLAFIIGLDTLANIPFAKLRLQGNPLKYVSVKALNVLIFVGLNVVFFYPLLTQDVSIILGFEITKINGVAFVFVANLLASIITLLVFIPQFLKQQWSFCNNTWKSMMRYGLPFVIVGLAGIVNETLDRILLKYLLPYDTLDERMAKVGIYSAAYKLSIFMNLVVQAFRMGAEPFFFKQAGEKDAKEIYASIMKYFTIFCLIVFLAVSLNIDLIIQVLGEKYHEGKDIVPIILMAYLFLGVFYNLSVWYKVNDKTHYAIFIAIAGALITIAINVVFIPIIGYKASAWATLWAYVGMSFISWIWGRKYYKIDYPIVRILKYFILGVGIFFLSQWLNFENIWMGLIINNLLLVVFIGIAYLLDLKNVLKQS